MCMLICLCRVPSGNIACKHCTGLHNHLHNHLRNHLRNHLHSDLHNKLWTKYACAQAGICHAFGRMCIMGSMCRCCKGYTGCCATISYHILLVCTLQAGLSSPRPPRLTVMALRCAMILWFVFSNVSLVVSVVSGPGKVIVLKAPDMPK